MIRFRASARWRWLRKGVGRENYLTLISPKPGGFHYILAVAVHEIPYGESDSFYRKSRSPKASGPQRSFFAKTEKRCRTILALEGRQIDHKNQSVRRTPRTCGGPSNQERSATVEFSALTFGILNRRKTLHKDHNAQSRICNRRPLLQVRLDHQAARW